MANRYYIGPGAWNNTGVWSLTSGGATGASVPGAGDVAIFDANSGACTVDVKPTILGLDLQAGYASLLQLATFGITTGTSGLIVAGGSFHMGSAACGLNAGDLTITTAGTVTLTSDVMTMNSATFTASAGTLTHNSGSVVMTRSLVSAHQYVDINGRTLYDITTDYDSYNLYWKSDLTVEGTLLGTGGKMWSTLTAAVITLKGDLDTRDDTGYNSIFVKIVIDGTGDQEIRSNSVVSYRSIPSLEINKTSGTLSFTGKLALHGYDATFEHIAGTVDWSGCTALYLYCRGLTMTMTSGDFAITCPILVNTANYSFTVVDAALVITNTLTFVEGKYNSSGGGEIHLQGAVIDMDAGTSSITTGVYRINGTGDQVMDSPVDLGSFGTLIIDKPSGTLTVTGSFRNYGSVTPQLEYIQGDVDASGSTIVVGSANTTFKLGAMVLGNLTLDMASFNFTTDGELIVSGDLTITLTKGLNQINSGKISLHGDLSSDDTALTTGDCPIYLVGTGDQEIGVSGVGFTLGDLIVDKPSGEAVLTEDFDPVTFNGDLLVVQGVLKLDGFDVSIATNFNVSTGTLALDGDETVTVGGSFSLNTGSTVRYDNPAVIAILDDLAQTFWNLILGAGKTHKVTHGAGAGIVINGIFSTNGTSSNRALLASHNPPAPGDRSVLTLNGGSALSDTINASDMDSSAGITVDALGSIVVNCINWNVAPVGEPKNPFVSRLVRRPADGNFVNVGDCVRGVVEWT